MTDIQTPLQRHNTMSAIRGKNTKPEMIVRRGLWKRGFRYRLNYKRLPGHPDLVLVSGMGMRVANTIQYPKPTLSSGLTKCNETKNVMKG